jgi:hypothetical protein
VGVSAVQPATWPYDLRDPAVLGQPRAVELATLGDLGLEGGVAGGDALGIDPPDRRPIALWAVGASGSDSPSDPTVTGESSDASKLATSRSADHPGSGVGSSAGPWTAC